MATSIDYIEFVMDSLSGIQLDFRYKKMFGEYCIYANDKPILLACDNNVLVKMHPCIESLMINVQTIIPYKGSKPYYLLDMDNHVLVSQVVKLLEQNTEIPKPRKRKHLDKA